MGFNVSQVYIKKIMQKYRILLCEERILNTIYNLVQNNLGAFLYLQLLCEKGKHSID